MKFKKKLKSLEKFPNGEVPIDESFEYNGIELKCIKFHESCDLCYFLKNCENNKSTPVRCISHEREDGESAMYIKYES